MDTQTSTSLLEAIRDMNDDQAWNRFADRYRPMLIAFALRMRLDLNDAQDLAQEVLLAFVQSYAMGKYDRNKGRLRNWLFGICHRKMTDYFRKRARDASLVRQHADNGLWESLVSSEKAESVWEEEWRQSVFRACVDEISRRLSPRTFAAFDLYFLRDWPVEEVAKHLNMTPASVYKAKHAAMNKVRAIQNEMEDVW